MSQSQSRLGLQIQSLVARIELLELENRDLVQRVQALEANTVELVGEPVVEARAEPASTGTSAGATLPTAAAPAPGSDAFRGLVADEIGAFFLRCLRGERWGLSGREKVDLPNRLYVVCRGINNQLYDPVRVCTTWRAAKALVSAAGSRNEFGDSVFAGFASQWEAKRAVSAAGLSWPNDGR